MKRSDKIILKLVENGQPVTQRELAKEFDVSDRTIRTDLLEVEEGLKKYDLKLLKKPKIGTWISGDEEDFRNLLSDISESKITENSSEFSARERRSALLSTLLLGKNKVYKEYLMSEFFASKSTIEKDVQVIAQKLLKHNIELTSGQNGIYVTGDERDIRTTLAKYIKESVSKSTLHASPFQEVQKLFRLNLDSLKHILIETQKHYDVAIESNSLDKLTVHLAIIAERIKNKHQIKMPQDISQSLRLSKQREIAEFIAKSISKKFGIELPDQEVDCILLFLLANIPGLDYDESRNGEDQVKLEESATWICDDFISSIKKIAGIDLEEDSDFREDLILHLLSILKRVQYEMSIHNPLLENIKENYPYSYQLAWLINTSFSKYVNTTIQEDEVAFIALHLAVSMERFKKKVNTLVICSSGVGVSKMLAITLEKKFPEMNILSSGMGLVEEELLEHFDLIISTVPLNIDRPYIIVNPILSIGDVGKIQFFLNHYNKTEAKELLEDGCIFFEKATHDKDEYLKRLSTELYKNHYVSEGFFESVIERECLGNTEIGKGVVLTHGNPKYVKKSQIGMIIFEEPLKWNAEKIQFMVLLALSEKDIKKGLSNLEWFYKTLNNEEIIKKITKMKNSEEVIQVLLSQYNKYSFEKMNTVKGGV